MNHQITVKDCVRSAEGALQRAMKAVDFFLEKGWTNKAYSILDYIQMDRGDNGGISKKGYFLDRYGDFAGDVSCKHRIVGLSGCHWTGRTYTMPTVIVYR